MRFLVTVDKKLAAFIWRTDAAHTISAECGSRRVRCPICTFVRWLFRILGDPTHCERNAREDGLIQ